MCVCVSVCSKNSLGKGKKKKLLAFAIPCIPTKLKDLIAFALNMNILVRWQWVIHVYMAL